MATLVQKYGGTSVETPQHLIDVAQRILEEKRRGSRMIVVVSAMGQSTDELVDLARKVHPSPPRREMDMLLTAGERISMALLAMCLDSLGQPAISFTGSQSGIITDARHSDARIVAVRPFRIEEELERDRVVIVAGFQGVSHLKEVTTLGRGGSDTTAVALAIHFQSPYCEIYTDVPGILTADPRIVPSARTLPRISPETAMVLSHLGAQVLYRRAVALARKHRMPIRVLSPRTGEIDTWIGQPPQEETMQPDNPDPIESDRILSVALEPRCVALEIAGRPAPEELLALLEIEGSDWSWIDVQRMPRGGIVRAVRPGTSPPGASFEERARALEVSVRHRDDLAIVSLVGEGIVTRPGLAAELLGLLREVEIDVEATRTATVSLSLLVSAEKAAEAVRVLHKRYVEERE